MSQFDRIALEGADDVNPEVEAAAPEDETATAAVADATADAQDVAQEDDNVEQLETEQEELGEVEEAVAQESEGLTPQAARLLQITLGNIVGKRHAQKIIATENYSSGRGAQREAKQLALEGIKETLKQFWEAIKAQLKKFYNKVKSFFVKMFSAAKKLKDRAEKLQKKANDTVGTIEEKSFSFGQTKTIAVDGKYTDAGTVTKGLNVVRTALEGLIKVSKADEYERVIDEAASLIEATIKQGKSGGDVASSGLAVLKKLGEVSGVSKVGLTLVTDKKLKEIYVPADSKGSVSASPSLPGGKAIFTVTAENPTGKITSEDFTKVLKNTRTILGNDKYTPREVSEGDVKTLTTSQIDKVCDDVIEIAETAYTYEKAWERRDKFQAKLEREVDSVIKDVNSDKEEDGRVQRYARNYASAITGSVRRRTNFEAQFISYALNLGSAMLNYSERSLGQHKAK